MMSSVNAAWFTLSIAMTVHATSLGAQPTAGSAPGVGVDASAEGAPMCLIKDLATLNACVRNRAHIKALSFLNDVECSDEACCPGDALVILDNTSNFAIQGNGHTLVLRSSHRQCDVISGRNASNISIKDLNIDEDAASAACDPKDKPCEPAALFSNGAHIDLENVRLYNAPGFAVTVAGVDGFTFDRSAIVNAGIIGLYVGASSGGTPSNHIQILHSVFAQTRANAICLDGVRGTQQTDNVIAGNFLTQNHMHGVYLDPQGRPYDGGQIYLPNVVNATVRNNVIGFGYCENCNNAMVWGVELGPKAVSSVSFLSNVFFDSYGVAFFKNTGLKLDASDLFQNNRIYDLNGLSLTGTNALDEARVSGNTVAGSPTPAKGHLTPSYVIYRRQNQGHYAEASTEHDASGSTVEAEFGLSPAPRIGSPLDPVFGCTANSGAGGSEKREPASNSTACEQQPVQRILGFSYESSYPGAMPIYQCRMGQDRFVSWDPQCEGRIVEAQIGYALHRHAGS